MIFINHKKHQITNLKERHRIILIGAFTPEGTFDAAAKELEELKELGITVIEVMPVAEFPGRWNQGYDGVNLLAPFHLYGDYEAFKRFVD